MDDRKLKILAAVVDEYVQTGEPVGSKTIAALPHINVSAATVRNDMAVLEQLGLLEQPHTSAGRIPTFNGYRLYIDKLMTTETLSEKERQRLDDMLEAQGSDKCSTEVFHHLQGGGDPHRQAAVCDPADYIQRQHQKQSLSAGV